MSACGPLIPIEAHILGMTGLVPGGSRFLNLTSMGIADSSYILLGRIAQLGERRPYKPKVTGSSPVPPTKSPRWRGYGRKAGKVTTLAVTRPTPYTGA